MNIGDQVESATWITGDEPQELRQRYERYVVDAIRYLCFENGFVSGEVEFTEKHPMDDVIEAPDHVSGSRVRLLIGEATVVEKLIESPKGSFVANLELKDLQKLRGILRNYKQLTDFECDTIIEQLGPEAALDTLRH